jgi:hypothetical protein
MNPGLDFHLHGASELMKKLFISGIFVTALTFGITAWTLFDRPDVFLSVKSPSGNYLVELAGDKSRPTFPFMNHQVSFNLYEDGHQTVRDNYVYSGDLFDSDFGEMFPKYKWATDSVLRFGWDLEKSERSPDSLVVSNKSNKTVKYLKISARDMIFVFGMKPGSTVTLSAQPDSYVVAVGEFENGQKIGYRGVNFLGTRESNSTTQYCISVNDGAVSVESATSAGYTGSNGSNHKNPDVPKVAKCP